MVLPIIAAAMSVTGSIVSAYSSYQAGKESRDRARKNAELMRLDAAAYLQQGEQSAQEVGKQVSGVLGAQASSYASQGVKVDTGSAAMVAEQSLAAAGVDTVRLRREARKHYDNLYRQAQMMEDEGEAAARAGNMAAFGSVLSGSSQAASNYVSSSYKPSTKEKA
jgi:hypothetical protein